MTTPTTVLTPDGYGIFDGPRSSAPPYTGPTVFFYHLPFDPRTATTGDVSAAIDFVGAPTAALIDPLNYLGPSYPAMNIEEEILFSTLTVLPAGGVTSTSATEFGNLTLFLKSLLWHNQHTAISGGLGVAIPTADDVVVRYTGGTEAVRVSSRATHLLPFLGGVYAPNHHLADEPMGVKPSTLARLIHPRHPGDVLVARPVHSAASRERRGC